MRAVNLLPLESRSRSRRFPGKTLAVVGGFVLIATVLAALHSTGRSDVRDLEAELAALRVQVAALAAAPRPKPTASPEAVAALQARQGVLDTVLASRIAWDRILREVSLVLPEDVWLSSLSARAAVATASTAAPGSAGTAPAASAAAPAPGLGGQGVVINGYTYSVEGVARLLTRLELAPGLANVRLEKSAMTLIAKRPVASFVIVADLKPSGGAA